MKTAKDKNSQNSWKIGTSYSLANPIDLNAVKEAGLECMELTWQPLDIMDPEVKSACDQVVRQAAELGIEIWSLHIPFGTEWDPSQEDPSIRENVVSKVRTVLAYAQEWGIRTAVFHPSWEPIAPDEREKRLEAARITLGLLSRDAAGLGVRLAAECLPRTCLGHSADEMEYLVSGNPELGVCCDVNHLFKESPSNSLNGWAIGSLRPIFRITTVRMRSIGCPGTESFNGTLCWKP
ncbi:sugar phosphate isomerase/epimerase [Paenibacillus sp. CC-CFT747]|nr:sugar phosphate isomerase/epimerase [Paenibacillus sp. CC-CFT747]